VADLESIARLLLRGGTSLAESARDEARRILEELVVRGDLGADEAAEIEAAVLDAASAHRRWVDERLVGPLRGALRGAAEAAGRATAAAAAPGDELRARLGAIEARLDRIEQVLRGRGEG
jgi:polyhydroxyalkanoate synthesis regulator phasin